MSRTGRALWHLIFAGVFERHPTLKLILTEQGELLYRTAHDVFMKLEAARAKLTDSREKPHGELKVTTTPGIGIHWLTPRLGEFMDLFPDIRITLITNYEELDLAMRGRHLQRAVEDQLVELLAAESRHHLAVTEAAQARPGSQPIIS